MESLAYLLFALLWIVGFILILRWVGAWMFRINDVIRELKEIKKELRNKL